MTTENNAEFVLPYDQTMIVVHTSGKVGVCSSELIRTEKQTEEPKTINMVIGEKFNLDETKLYLKATHMFSSF
jgi:hypothetical protein